MASTSRFLRIPTGLTSASTLFPPLSAWSSVPPPQLRPLSASAHREEEIRLKLLFLSRYLNISQDSISLSQNCFYLYLLAYLFIWNVSYFDIWSNCSINRNFYCTSGIATKATRITAITRLIQNSHRRKVKYEATAEPKCDSISFMRNSHGISHVWRFTISLRQYCHFCIRDKWDKIKKKSNLSDDLSLSELLLLSWRTGKHGQWRPSCFESEPTFPEGHPRASSRTTSPVEPAWSSYEAATVVASLRSTPLCATSTFRISAPGFRSPPSRSRFYDIFHQAFS